MRPRRFLYGCQAGSISTVEITAKTIRDYFLLKPDPFINSIIAGVLARAKERYGVAIHAHVVASNHMHLLISVDGIRTQKRFMRYVMSNTARKVGKAIGWQGRFWARRYRSIEVSRDEESLVDRFDYILRHGTKEGLVPCPTQWPGLHCAWALANNQWTFRGHWDDHTKAYRMRQRGQRARRKDYRQDEFFELDPLPCWEHLERAEIGDWVVERLAQIRDDYADLEFLGVRKIQRQSIEDRPKNPKRSEAPSFHAKDPVMRRMMRDAYREFLRFFLSASARMATFFEAHDEPYYFPPGCHPPWPPSLPESA